MNILIVEDDYLNQSLLGFQAEAVQFRVNVVTADDGEAALDRLVDSAPIGLILLDLGMPRMDGYEFLHRLRAIPDHGATPVIVVTARDLSEWDYERLRAMGVLRIFQKGRYDTDMLTEAIIECAH